MSIDQQKTYRRAQRFGYDLHQAARGWTLSRDGKSYAFDKLSGVVNFLNAQVLR